MIKKGDTIIVLTGKDKGKKSKVLEVFLRESRVLVEGVNVKKRHQRPRKSNEKGQILEVALPIHISNVALIDPKTGKATRVGSKVVGGKKVRVSKKSGSEI